MNKPLDGVELSQDDLRMLRNGLQLLVETMERYVQEFPDDPDERKELAEAWKLQARIG